MNVVRVLIRVISTGSKPDLPPDLIHKIHLTDDPLSACDRIFHGACCTIVKIKMIPTMPLRHPYPLVFDRRVLAKLLPGIVNKSRAGFLNYRTGFPRFGIKRYYPQYLLNIVEGIWHRMPSILRRGLNKRHLSRQRGFFPLHHEITRVWSPKNRSGVAIFPRPILRQGKLLFPRSGRQIEKQDILGTENHFPFAIRRTACFTLGFQILIFRNNFTARMTGLFIPKKAPETLWEGTYPTFRAPLAQSIRITSLF